MTSHLLFFDSKVAFCIIFNKNLSIFYCNRRRLGKLGNMAQSQGTTPGFLSIWWLVRWKKMAWFWCRSIMYNQQILIQSLFQILAKHLMHFQQATSRNYLFFYKSKACHQNFSSAQSAIFGWLWRGGGLRPIMIYEY